MAGNLYFASLMNGAGEPQKTNHQQEKPQHGQCIMVMSSSPLESRVQIFSFSEQTKNTPFCISYA